MHFMARGWESKSVEEQQSAASTQVESKQRLTPEQAAVKQAREALELSRRQVLQQLNPAITLVIAKCLKARFLSWIAGWHVWAKSMVWLSV